VQAEAIVEIVNKKGLHARATAKFVKIASAYDAKIIVVNKGADGASDSAPVEGVDILDLLMLGADIGSKLHISATGAQSVEAIDALRQLVAEKFGEEE
jgi:phosphocarrier protein